MGKNIEFVEYGRPNVSLRDVLGITKENRITETRLARVAVLSTIV